MIVWTLAVTLTMKTANQSCWKTLWLMVMHHHTKSGSNRFSGSEDTVWTNIHIKVHHHHQSLNCEGCWGTTDDFTTSFLHFSLFSTALWDLPNSRPVHSLMLSFHLFLCLPCLLPPLTMPCMMVLATWWTGDMTIPLQFASLYDGQEVFVWSNCSVVI